MKKRGDKRKEEGRLMVRKRGKGKKGKIEGRERKKGRRGENRRSNYS